MAPQAARTPEGIVRQRGWPALGHVGTDLWKKEGPIGILAETEQRAEKRLRSWRAAAAVPLGWARSSAAEIGAGRELDTALGSGLAALGP